MVLTSKYIKHYVNVARKTLILENFFSSWYIKSNRSQNSDDHFKLQEKSPDVCLIQLLEANVAGIFFEAAPTHVQAVLSDQAVRIAAHATKKYSPFCSE